MAHRAFICDKATVAASCSPTTGYSLSTPSLVRSADGALLLSYDRYSFDRTRKTDCTATICRSVDDGSSWTESARLSASQGRLFRVGRRLHYIGHAKTVVIACSNDEGVTWSPLHALTDEIGWHQTAANVHCSATHVYLVMERITQRVGDTWYPAWLAPTVMRAPLDADLTLASNWYFSPGLPFHQLIPGFVENSPAIDFFPVPFYPQAYPLPLHLGRGRLMHPMGWLETHIVQLQDPNHCWHDASGKTFHLLMRAHTGGTGFACLAKAVEHRDGQMTVTLEMAPSGKKVLFLPFPGGHLRFHIEWDEPSQLFWLVGNQATDSTAAIYTAPASQQNLPNNERNRLVLHFSRNLIDWCFAGVIAIGLTPQQTRCYPSFIIDDDELIIACRAGSDEAHDARDTDLVHLYRVPSFRSLVY